MLILLVNTKKLKNDNKRLKSMRFRSIYFASILRIEMITVLFLIAPGFEPLEAIAPIDYLKRAGATVVLAAVGTEKLGVKSALGLKIKCDVHFEDVSNNAYDAVVCPGGMPGAKNLATNEEVVRFIKKHFENNKIVGAICASPGLVLAEACGIMKGKNGCGYPGFDNKIAQYEGNLITSQDVVVDGNVITSRGPATAVQFALALVKALYGEDKEIEIGKGTLYYKDQ